MHGIRRTAQRNRGNRIFRHQININYFINEVIDEDHQEDIFEYFKEADSDSLEDAIQELGSEYSEDEIRLMRIKFLSELGN